MSEIQRQKRRSDSENHQQVFSANCLVSVASKWTQSCFGSVECASHVHTPNPLSLPFAFSTFHVSYFPLGTLFAAFVLLVYIPVFHFPSGSSLPMLLYKLAIPIVRVVRTHLSISVSHHSHTTFLPIIYNYINVRYFFLLSRYSNVANTVRSLVNSYSQRQEKKYNVRRRFCFDHTLDRESKKKKERKEREKGGKR